MFQSFSGLGLSVVSLSPVPGVFKWFLFSTAEAVSVVQKLGVILPCEGLALRTE